MALRNIPFPIFFYLPIFHVLTATIFSLFLSSGDERAHLTWLLMAIAGVHPLRHPPLAPTRVPPFPHASFHLLLVRALHVSVCGVVVFVGAVRIVGVVYGCRVWVLFVGVVCGCCLWGSSTDGGLLYPGLLMFVAGALSTYS